MNQIFERKSDSLENIDIKSSPSESRNSIYSQTSSTDFNDYNGSNYFLKMMSRYVCCCSYYNKKTTLNLESDLLKN